MLSDVAQTALAARGWATIEFGDQDHADAFASLEALASSLGVPVAARNGEPLVSTLRPLDGHEARPNSLSATFALGPFPYHADTAHWIVPCRYVLLACLDPGEGERPTLLLDTRRIELSHDQRAALLSTPFRIANGRESFFSTVLQEGRPFVRYDPGCMKAVSPIGERVLRLFTTGDCQRRADLVSWRRGRCIIVDNWRVLHGRGEATREDRRRTLLRAYVKGGVQ